MTRGRQRWFADGGSGEVVVLQRRWWMMNDLVCLNRLLNKRMEEGLFDPSPSAETREFLSKPLFAGHGLFPILLLALIFYSGLPSITGRSIRHRTVRQRRDLIQTLDQYALAFKPASKSSAWILNKFRSRPSNTGPSSNNEIPPEIPNPPKNPTVDNNLSGRKRSWAIPDDECDNWSEDVIEFLKHGDTPFCYSAVFFRDVKLDKLFWGWTGRLMTWRRREMEKNPSNVFRWSILPPQFFDVLVSSITKNALCYGNRKMRPYPSFFDVDYVFIRLCIKNQEWSLVRVDLRNMSMVWYCIESESFGGDTYRSFVLPKLKQMGVYFSALLVNMCFWKKTRQPEGYLIFEVNDDFAQTDVSLAADEGLYVCMLMEHLVTGKPINASGDLKLELKKYRRFMADLMYFWRILPR
ncbi:hypothetical protein R6Q57_017700 [Mikania cordata]